MRFNHTNCFVLLIGYLNSMPFVSAQQYNETYVTVLRYNFESNSMEEYRVIVSDQDAKRIIFSGFPGIPISISGQLRNKNNPEIVADKIDFIYYPGGCGSQPEFVFNFEKKKTDEKLDGKLQKLFDHAVKDQYTRIH